MPNPAIGALIADEATIRVLFTLTNKPPEILKKLQAAFFAGSEFGEKTQKVADRFQQIIAVPRKEAISIVSNVWGFVLSKVRFDGQVSAGMTHKRWFCPPSCPCPIVGHGQAGEKYTTPIPISEPFIVNGVPLMHPRDYDSGHVEECIDCLCACFASILRK